jgi:hypothetical protein
MPADPVAILASGGAASPTRASLTTALAGNNNDIVWQAVAPGTGGNSLTIQYTISGSAPVAITTVGSAPYTGLLITGGTTTTGQQIVDAWRNANAAVKSVASPAIAPGNDGTGAVVSMAATALSGGTGTLPLAPTSILS